MSRLEYFQQCVATWTQEDINKCDGLLDYFIDWAEYMKYPKPSKNNLPPLPKIYILDEDRPPTRPPHP